MKSLRVAITAAAVVFALAAVADPAFAHPSASAGFSLSTGFLHPFGGLDHLLAMVGIGLWAALLQGRALWLMPLCFVLASAGAAALAAIVPGVPVAELGIGISVVALGLLAAGRVRMPLALAATIVFIFGAVHGHAHGVEMPADADGILYGLGFAAASLILHLGGMALGSMRPVSVGRVAGAAMGVVGVLMMI